MGRATWLQTNFNGGEMSPLAWGRVDIDQYHRSLALCQNFMPTEQGGLTRRPGTRYVAAVKTHADSPRLQRFEFSTSQAYVLEFGHHYVRFYTNDGQLQSGGVPYEVYSPYAISDVSKLCFTQSADVLFIAHPNYEPRQLQRLGELNWSLTSLDFLDGPYLPTNTTPTTLTPSATVGTVTVTASGTAGINDGAGFSAADVGRLLRLRYGGVWLWGTITYVASATMILWEIGSLRGSRIPAQAQATCAVSAGSIYAVSITDGGSGYGVTPPSVRFDYPGNPRATAHAIVTNCGISSVVVDNGGGNYASSGGGIAIQFIGGGGYGAEASPVMSGSTIRSIVVTKPGTGYTSAPTVVILGGFNTRPITTNAVAYASLVEGSVASISMASVGANYLDTAEPIISAPVTTSAVPSTTGTWRLGVWGQNNGYPSVVAFHQERLWWGGCTQYPNRLDSSNSGDYLNMSPSLVDGVITDASSIGISLNSPTVDAIQWMTTDEWGLLVGTAGGEWCVAPSTQQTALTPTNINAKQLSTFGSAAVPPNRVGKSTLFVQRTGRKLRELTYQFVYNTFNVVDISLAAEHLTKGGIKQLATQLAPIQTLWVVRNDGALVGVTYNPDQKICGWHRHVVGGVSDIYGASAKVESVACIPALSTQRDEVWLVVNRCIEGMTYRSVEVMSKVWEDGDDVADGCFLDGSGVYSGSSTSTVTGLTWLAGETVSVLADGSVHPDCLVDYDGTITLTRKASTVQVGLAYTSKAVTLSPEVGGNDGPSQGKMKRVFKAAMRFFQTIGIQVGSAAPGVVAYPEPWRTSADPMDGPPALFDGFKKWSYEGGYDLEGQLYFQKSDPLPCNITALMAQLESKDME